MKPYKNWDEEVVKAWEENPKSWCPGLAEHTGPKKELVQEHPCPRRPPSLPGLPSGTPLSTSPSI